jgi:hypothetical protein
MIKVYANYLQQTRLIENHLQDVLCCRLGFVIHFGEKLIFLNWHKFFLLTEIKKLFRTIVIRQFGA